MNDWKYMVTTWEDDIENHYYFYYFDDCDDFCTLCSIRGIKFHYEVNGEWYL